MAASARVGFLGLEEDWSQVPDVSVIQLPFEMTDGLGFSVMKGQIHRVIKGVGPLKIELHKNIL